MKTIQGTQKLIISGDDWGPAVTKTILSFETPVQETSLSKDTFKVTETKETTDFTAPDFPRMIASVDRKVTAVYLSDAEGNPTFEEASPYVTIEMYVSPQEGSPFFYDMKTNLNDWCVPYALSVTGKVMTEDGEAEVDVENSADRPSRLKKSKSSSKVF